MSIQAINDSYGKFAHKKLLGAEITEKNQPENPAAADSEDSESSLNVRDRVELSPEGLRRLNDDKKEEAKKTNSPDAEESDQEVSCRVGVNAGKRARQIAAAQSSSDVQAVLKLLNQDLSECRAGLEQGFCDEAEVAKVEALIKQANSRMNQVGNNKEETPDTMAFDIASLI